MDCRYRHHMRLTSEQQICHSQGSLTQHPLTLAGTVWRWPLSSEFTTHRSELCDACTRDHIADEMMSLDDIIMSGKSCPPKSPLRRWGDPATLSPSPCSCESKWVHWHDILVLGFKSRFTLVTDRIWVLHFVPCLVWLFWGIWIQSLKCWSYLNVQLATFAHVCISYLEMEYGSE